MKAFKTTYFYLSVSWTGVPFHPSWNHWSYLEAEPCSDAERDLPGSVPLQPVLLPSRMCLGESLLQTPSLGKCLSFLFCILTKALAKLTPKQTFHWNQDIGTCELRASLWPGKH